jgi:hypothetical protein
MGYAVLGFGFWPSLSPRMVLVLMLVLVIDVCFVLLSMLPCDV